jgi:membrane fusion protein (multidrug efflux system)
LTRTVRLTAEIPNPDETLKAGMFLSVILQVQVKADAVIVPEEAIVGEGLRHLVFVVKDRVVERRVVRIGQRQEGRVEIVEGLKPGETIIIRGVQRVRPGLTVEPKPVADAPTAEAAPKQTAAPASGNAPSPAAQAVPAPPSVAGRRS